MRQATLWRRGTFLAMSQVNIDLVHAVFDAYKRGDEPGMLALVAPDVVVTQFPDQLDLRDYHGHEGLKDVMASWIGTWEDWSIEPLRMWDSGDFVFVTALQRGRGRGSGVPMEAEVTFVFTIQGGAIVRWQMFQSEREAHEAAGVGEEDG